MPSKNKCTPTGSKSQSSTGKKKTLNCWTDFEKAKEKIKALMAENKLLWGKYLNKKEKAEEWEEKYYQLKLEHSKAEMEEFKIKMYALRKESSRIVNPAGMDAQCARCKIAVNCHAKMLSSPEDVEQCCPVNNTLAIKKAFGRNPDKYLKEVFFPEQDPPSGVRIDIEQPFLN